MYIYTHIYIVHILLAFPCVTLHLGCKVTGEVLPHSPLKKSLKSFKSACNNCINYWFQSSSPNLSLKEWTDALARCSGIEVEQAWRFHGTNARGNWIWAAEKAHISSKPPSFSGPTFWAWTRFVFHTKNLSTVTLQSEFSPYFAWEKMNMTEISNALRFTEPQRKCPCQYRRCSLWWISSCLHWVGIRG